MGFRGGGGGVGAVVDVVVSVVVSQALLPGCWVVLLHGFEFFGQSLARYPLSLHLKHRPLAQYCAHLLSVSF